MSVVLGFGYCCKCKNEDSHPHIGSRLICWSCLNTEQVLFEEKTTELVKERDRWRLLAESLQIDVERLQSSAGGFTAHGAMASRQLDDAVRALREIAYDISTTPPLGVDETGDFHKNQLKTAISLAANALALLHRNI